MAFEKEVRAGLKAHRRQAQAALAVLGALMLAAPPVVVALSTGWSPLPLALANLSAMYAFTLIFMNIMTGALAPWSYAVFGPRGGNRVHLLTGVTGFLLALAHGAIMLAEKYFQGYGPVWIVGPVALGLLAVTGLAALDRARLKKLWRAIHQVNYAIFIAVYAHALWIGVDLRRDSSASDALLLLFTAYVLLALAAMLIRVLRYREQARSRAERAAVPGTDTPGD